MADTTTLLSANARIVIAEAMIAACNAQNVETCDVRCRGAMDIVFWECDR